MQATVWCIYTEQHFPINLSLPQPKRRARALHSQRGGLLLHRDTPAGPPASHSTADTPQLQSHLRPRRLLVRLCLLPSQPSCLWVSGSGTWAYVWGRVWNRSTLPHRHQPPGQPSEPVGPLRVRELLAGPDGALLPGSPNQRRLQLSIHLTFY